jgi:hypothetical protein
MILTIFYDCYRQYLLYGTRYNGIDQVHLFSIILVVAKADRKAEINDPELFTGLVLNEDEI